MQSDIEDEPPIISRNGWISLCIGPALAVILIFIPFTKWTLGYFSILVHEFGHTFFYWLFGYPAIPSFDFSHGGGITLGLARNIWLFVGLQLLLIPIAISAFKRKLYAIIFVAVVIVWLCLAYTSSHLTVIVYMGHGMELLIAGIFIYRATTGVALEREYERPIYATLAFYLIIDNIIFSINLISNQSFRYLYENDVRQLVNDFKYIAFFNLGNADISVVASFHLLMCLVTFALAVFCIRFVRWNC